MTDILIQHIMKNWSKIFWPTVEIRLGIEIDYAQRKANPTFSNNRKRTGPLLVEEEQEGRVLKYQKKKWQILWLVTVPCSEQSKQIIFPFTELPVSRNFEKENW